MNHGRNQHKAWHESLQTMTWTIMMTQKELCIKPYGFLVRLINFSVSSYISLMFYFMLKVPGYIAIKYMCEILYKKIKGIQCRRCRRCQRYIVQISMHLMLCMSETSEMVFAALTQHCMQSTDIMTEMSKILCIQWPLTPPGGKARCSCTVRPVG